MTSFEPLHDNVLVEVLPPDERKTPGGVILPLEVEDERTLFATVRAVGPGLFLDSGERLKPEVNPGDIVLIEENVGLLVNLEGKAYQVVRYDHLLGVVYRAPEESSK